MKPNFDHCSHLSPPPVSNSGLPSLSRANCHRVVLRTSLSPSLPYTQVRGGRWKRGLSWKYQVTNWPGHAGGMERVLHGVRAPALLLTRETAQSHPASGDSAAKQVKYDT